MLVEYGANVHNVLLNESVANGHLELVEFLISQGVAVVNELSLPIAVNIAIRNGHVDIIEILMKKGAHFLKWEDFSKFDFSTNQAIKNRHTEVMRYLISKGVQLERFLLDSIECNDVIAVEYLLELGADGKAKTFSGWSCLEMAMSRYYSLQSYIDSEERLKSEKIIALLQEKGSKM